jgi:predicted nucleotidyltransferase
MRLTEAEIDVIRGAVRARFGADSAIWLFGSRLDNAVRGGDIDLYVEPAAVPSENLFLAREALRRELQQRLRCPVDLLVRRGEATAFMRQAKAEGQPL